MTHEFPSEEWIRAWRAAVNGDEAYAEAADGWGVEFDGDTLFHLRADDRLPDDRYYYVELEDGRATDARAVDDPDAVDFGFALRADYVDWVRVVDGEVDPVASIMSCLFDVDGDMQRLLQYSEAATRLVEIAADIDSAYRY